MHAHKTRIRVRYQETNNMGIVYYSNYFVYFEVARTECFRDIGIVYTEIEKNGIYLVVVEAFCSYILPVRYDDVIEIETSV
ncbi:MAG: acyl-CoA thioesterase, partial [Candidatus Omnitrophica bacterium]|nr:acyl-CoA thioesterase [Candidatus Omnitrophota bacterium]